MTTTIDKTEEAVRIRRWTRRSASTLFMATFFLTLLISYPRFGIWDTYRRFQVTEAIWQQVPPVLEEDIANRQVVVGVNGTPHYWYGMGQSIFMLPGDIIARTLVGGVPGDESKEAQEIFLVIILTFPFFSAASVVIAFLTLKELGFRLRVAFVGALAFFFGTTFLHYTQIHQENIHVTFLILCAYYQFTLWLKNERWLHLALAGGLLGTLLLLRLTTAADIIGAGLFALLSLLSRHGVADEAPNSRLVGRLRQIWPKILTLGGTLAAGLGIFFLIDRLYQYKRFGSWTNTYLDVFKQQAHSGVFDTAFNYQMTPEQLPPNWPTSGKPLEAILGVLFSPEKSVFLYDPLLLVLFAVVVLRGFRLDRPGEIHFRRNWLISCLVSFVIYLIGYANLEFWGGDWAWGARYHLSPVQLACLLVVPLLLEKIMGEAHSMNEKSERQPGFSFNGLWKVGLLGLLGYTLVLQVASTTLLQSVETIQQKCGVGTDFRFAQRFVNIFDLIVQGKLTHFDFPCAWRNGFLGREGDLGYTVTFLPFSLNSPLQILIIGIWLLLVGFCLLPLYRLWKRLERANKTISAASQF